MALIRCAQIDAIETTDSEREDQLEEAINAVEDRAKRELEHVLETHCALRVELDVFVRF